MSSSIVAITQPTVNIYHTGSPKMIRTFISAKQNEKLISMLCVLPKSAKLANSNIILMFQG